MQYLPGNVVRRAALTVSSVASAATSAATGTVGSIRRGFDSERPTDLNDCTDEFILQSAKEKVNLTIKDTPSKDALVTSALSVKKLYAMKRNEQGVWHKKLICMMPHMFLYYFDSDTSDSPRGVIDLHYYNDISVEGEGNVLKLSAPDETNLRSFYFQIDDPTSLGEFITSLHRDRYNVVRDERDAYQELQSQFSGEMSNKTKQISSSTQELENLQRMVDEANKKASAGEEAIQRALIRLEVTEEEVEGLVNINAMGAEMVARVEELKERLESVIDEHAKTLISERANFEVQISRVEDQLVAEQAARKQAETLLASDKRESDDRIREMLGKLDKLNLDMSMLVEAKNVSEEKVEALTEQKKVLVKEVKQQRKKHEQSSETISQLKDLNERLTAAATALQEECKTLATRLATANSNLAAAYVTIAAAQSQAQAQTQSSPTSLTSGGEGTGASDGAAPPSPSSDASLLGAASALAGAMAGAATGAVVAVAEAVTGSATDATDSSIVSATSIDVASLRYSGSDSESADDAKRRSGRRSSALSTADGPVDFDLDDEEEEANQALAAADAAASSTGNLSSPLSSFSFFSHAASGASPTSSTTAPTRRGSSLGALVSMFQHDKVSSAPALSVDEDGPGYRGADSVADSVDGRRGSLLGSGAGGDRSSGTFRTPTKVVEGSTDPSTASTASVHAPLSPADSEVVGKSVEKKLLCLRCNGTVEGPKYSTCKCAIPALCAEDLSRHPATATAGSFFTGMLSKTSLMAGGLAKATGSGVESLYKGSSSHSSSHDASSPSQPLHSA